MTRTTRHLAATAFCLAAILPAQASDLLGGLLNQALGQVANEAVRQVLTPGQQGNNAGNNGNTTGSNTTYGNAGGSGAALSPAQLIQSLGGGAIGVTGAGNAAGGADFKLESGAKFTPHYVVQNWRQPSSVAPLDGPSGAARGHVTRQTAFGGDLGVPGGAEMRRKLDKLYALLLDVPSLNQPVGVSLVPGGSFGGSRGAPRGPAVVAHLSIRAFPIRLDNPATVRHPDGTVHTTGFGDSLNVLVNDLRALARPEVLGTYNGLTILRRGGLSYQILLMNTHRPLLANGELNPDLLDPSRPPSDIQFMVIYVGGSSPTWVQLGRGQLPAGSGTGRLLAAAYNTDWPVLLRQIQ
ncbi:MAG: hypothetical protein Q7T87_17450 [Polaromonas sp.]|nr:hypothetical protein [Polaromonas sp.]